MTEIESTTPRRTGPRPWRGPCAPPAIAPSEPPPIADAAAAAGLLDVAYATLDSPVGTLLLAATPVGLVRLAYLDDEQEDAVLAELADAAVAAGPVGPAPARRAAPRARRVLRRRAGTSSSCALDMRLMTRVRAARARRRRPRSRTARSPPTARWRPRAGSPRGSRAAGNALGANPLPIVIPCHRVLHSGGGLGGYTGGARAQAHAAGDRAAGRRTIWPTDRADRGSRRVASAHATGGAADETVRVLPELPPGPSMPAAIQLARHLDAPRPVAGAAARYGKRVTVRLPFQPPFVMLSDPADIKELFTAPAERSIPARARGSWRRSSAATR